MDLCGDHYGMNTQSLPFSPRFYKLELYSLILREEEVSLGNRLSGTGWVDSEPGQISGHVIVSEL